MIDKQAAQAAARAKLTELGYDDTVAIAEAKTLERDFGWVFFWNNAEYLATKDFQKLVVGASPLIVDKRDGSVHTTYSGKPLEGQLEEYSRDHP